MRSRRYFAGASFECSPPASSLPPPPSQWIKDIDMRKNQPKPCKQRVLPIVTVPKKENF